MAGLSLERRQADHRPPCLRDAALLSAAAPERPWQSLEVAALRRAAPCRNLPRCRTLPAIHFLGNAFLSPLAGILPSATPLQHTRFFAAMLWPVLIAPHAVQVPQSCLAEGPDCGPCLLPQGGGGPPAQRAKPAGRRPCPVREAPLLRQRPRARGGRRRAGGLCGRPAWGRLPGHGLCRYRFQQRWRSGRWGSRQRYRQPVAEATA